MIRDYEKSDYPLLLGWWHAQKFPPPPQEFLPQTGYIAHNAAAGFLYLSNSPIVWMEWVVVDPKAPREMRKEAITQVIEHICKQAQRAGGKMVFTTSNFFPYIGRLKSLGFQVGDTKTTQLFRSV